MSALSDSNANATIPARDLQGAKLFYADKLGLTPAEERPEGLRYRCGVESACCSNRAARRR